MKNTKFSSFYLHTNEKQVGDRKRDTVTTYHMILRPTSVMNEEQRRFLCEYNRMTKTATFPVTNVENLSKFRKWEIEYVVDFIYAMAQQVFSICSVIFTHTRRTYADENQNNIPNTLTSNDSRGLGPRMDY